MNTTKLEKLSKEELIELITKNNYEKVNTDPVLQLLKENYGGSAYILVENTSGSTYKHFLGFATINSSNEIYVEDIDSFARIGIPEKMLLVEKCDEMDVPYLSSGVCFTKDISGIIGQDWESAGV